MKAERQLPCSIEAEKGVLGSCLIDSDAITLVADFLTPQDFYRDAHQTIYSVMLSLHELREPSDLITIDDELQRRGKLEEVGGMAAIVNLINSVPTSSNVEYYGRIVAQKGLLRRLIHVAADMASSAYEEESDALEKAEQSIFALGQHHRASDFSLIHDVITECMANLGSVRSQESQESIVTGVPTGFRHLDVPLGGLQRSDLVILSARPAVGKTSFALNVASNAAYESKRRVAFFSLEMSKKQLGIRLISMASGVDQQRLRLGYVHDEEWGQVVEAMEKLTTGAIWIDDTPAITLAALRSKARRLQAEQGIDLIVVDYLQLMRATLEGKRYQNREQEIAEISRGLKGIAKELDVPVLALAQLSRAVESRQSKIPQLSDLRESGAIENDADVVLFIYREELYEPEKEEVRNTADIIIAKHRNGPVGTVRLRFEASQTRFSPLDFDEEKGDEA